MMELEKLNAELKKIKEIAYDPCSLKISQLMIEPEGKDYNACSFQLNQLNIICRTAKTTPKKIGQFVTCWKRNKNGATEPFHESNKIDYYVINVLNNKRLGQFVIPKSALLENGILGSTKKAGKRGFRVYPAWDTPTSKQAVKTQKWQLEYFYELSNTFDPIGFKKLYQSK